MQAFNIYNWIPRFQWTSQIPSSDKPFLNNNLTSLEVGNKEHFNYSEAKMTHNTMKLGLI